MTSLIISADPDAEPNTSDNPSMEEGYVENRCTADDDCGGGQCLLDDEFTLSSGYGYCSIANCESDDVCPSDSNCFTTETLRSIPYPSFCAKKCSTHEDCRTEDEIICDENKKSCVPGIW